MVVRRIVPPRWPIPRTESRVRVTHWSSPNKPANPLRIPMTSHPLPVADSTAARITALSPGASPPPVEIPIRVSGVLAKDRRSAALTPQQANDLARCCVSAKLRLLENRAAVSAHLEATTSRLNQFHSNVRERLTNLGRQTGGPRLVASNRAVLDGDGHCSKRWGELNRNSNATVVPVPQCATGTPARFASCRMTVS